jgi:hypothetical protein
MKPQRYLPLIGAILFLILAYLYLQRSKIQQAPSAPSQQEALPSDPGPSPVTTPPSPSAGPAIQKAPLKKANRLYYGDLPEDVSSIDDLIIVNRYDPQWKKKMEVHIKRLGGDKLKDYSLTPQESYIIADSGGGRLVERVLVKLESKDGQYTSFFAEVDSESGYVLKTWGMAIPEKKRHSH